MSLIHRLTNTAPASEVAEVKELLSVMGQQLRLIQQALDRQEQIDSSAEEGESLMMSARRRNVLAFPENRRAIEKLFAKRGCRPGDTIDKVFEEATRNG